MPFTPQYIIIHHSASNDGPKCDTAAIRRWHVKGNKWSDIGYNALIENVGGAGDELLIGRPWNRSGAHCRGWNRKAFGLVVVGNFEADRMDIQTWRALIHHVHWLRRYLNIPAKNVLGHNEVPGARTACPGKYLDMDRLREAVR